MSKLLFEGKNTYFLVGKCFYLQNPLALAYLSQLGKMDDLKTFREKLFAAKEYIRAQSPDQDITNYLRCYFTDDMELNPEESAEEEKREEYARLILTDDYIPYTLIEVYESITSFNVDISIINASLEYSDTYVGFLVPINQNMEGLKIGMHYLAASIDSGWGKKVDLVIEEFIKIFGLSPNLHTLLLDEYCIVRGKNHPVTLPPHRQKC